jgi:hypothetical protein
MHEREKPPTLPESVLEHEIELDDVLRRRTLGRTRALLSMALIVVVGAVAHSLGSAFLGEYGQRHIAGSTPTPVRFGPVLVASNVSLGTLTLNGRPLGTPRW